MFEPMDEQNDLESLLEYYGECENGFKNDFITKMTV